MSNNDLNNTLRGYWLVNSLIGNAARHLAEENRKIEKEKLKQDLFNSHYQTKEQLADKIGRYILSEQTETAYDFLNTSLREELIHDCKNQRSFTTPLSELIVQRKEKYRPFYEKLGRKIPTRIDNITAEELCFIMDKELLSHESTIREQGREALCGQSQVTVQKGDSFGQDQVEEKDKDCEENNNTKLNAEQFIQQFKKTIPALIYIAVFIILAFLLFFLQ